ncbi:hypothetical protein FPZ12_020300 [Amycolatopsis acidicola]|uniref:Uncharacterized protein n=1 Tax=Amycolatopsis acidicola TaxID=2596893 RepID=A0A5N0V118_9PSEU|nr:hypothetical protein [Amycolatopsis acidicola]KAA9159446.1 hypothetical protein FPZ12_020300 [Amycolatopsis acidicola]
MVRLTATTAVVEMSATQAFIMVCYLQSQAAQDHGATVHPYKSLNAVRRKLEELEAAETREPPAPLLRRTTQRPPRSLSELLRFDPDE